MSVERITEKNIRFLRLKESLHDLRARTFDAVVSTFQDAFVLGLLVKESYSPCKETDQIFLDAKHAENHLESCTKLCDRIRPFTFYTPGNTDQKYRALLASRVIMRCIVADNNTL